MRFIKFFFFFFFFFFFLLLLLLLLDPATVIAGVTLGAVVLESVVDRIGSLHRKVAVGVDNESGYK